MPTAHLTAFGFTPTESVAYLRLLEDGPSSGYALAKRLSIARANAYQALNGLVAKGAAELAGVEPRTYRAVQAQALLAKIARETASRLDELERQIGDHQGAGAPAIVPFSGDAEFNALVLRTAVRPTEPVEFLAPAVLITASVPVWRTRQVNGRPTRIRCIGPIPPDLPIDGVTAIDEADARGRVGDVPIVLLAPGVAILGGVGPTGVEGYWTSDPILVRAAHALQTVVAADA
jgi:predicted transcriptional regulator